MFTCPVERQLCQGRSGGAAAAGGPARSLLHCGPRPRSHGEAVTAGTKEPGVGVKKYSVGRSSSILRLIPMGKMTLEVPRMTLKWLVMPSAKR